MLLTPWLYRLLDRPAARAVLYAVTPATLCARYVLSVAGLSLPVQAFCGSWLLFYLLGLEWKWRIAPWLRSRGIVVRHALAALAACLIMQEMEGFAWLYAGNYDLATTQLKATSAISSNSACALIAIGFDTARRRFILFRPLAFLGDLSFGIYLFHMMALAALTRVFESVGLCGFLSAFALWIAVLVVSALFVLLCQKLLPTRIVRALGFV